MLNLKKLEPLIKIALAEDIGKGDVTSQAIIPEKAQAKAQVVAKGRGILAGLPVAELVFKTADKNIKFTAKKKDGSKIKKGNVLAEISGPASSILKAERVALNFLQKLSGIATTTNEFVKKVKWLSVKILDTRKTTPCFRELEKYAVALGGGTNHRMGLYDAVLIKDNHIALVKSVKEAVKRAQKNAPGTMRIEVEAKSLRDVKAAIEAGANVILLDNMNLIMLIAAVRMIKKHNQKVVPQAKILIEASGGVNLKNVRRIARTGVDFISVGALTHSPRALDISLEII